jgi:transposase-like protein
MLKTDAIEALGGTVAATAREVGITPQAVGQWPDELPPAIRDRVQAALWRRAHARAEEAELINTEGAPDVPAAAEPAALGAA